jgi:hypothetical protein
VKAARQFVAVKFRSGDKRAWTYHWDGAPLACGELVRVPDRSGDGWQRATVHEIGAQPPAFITKAVLGRVADLPPVPNAAPDLLEAPSIVDRFRR